MVFVLQVWAARSWRGRETVRAATAMRLTVRAAVLWAATTAGMAVARPEWQAAAHTGRIVFERPAGEGRTVLVGVPRSGGDVSPGAFAVFTGDGLTLPFRVAARGTERIDVLVDCDAVPAGARVELYLGGSGPDTADDGVSDPRPLKVRVGGVQGRGIPTSWEGMLRLYAHAFTPEDAFVVSGFGRIDLLRGPDAEKPRVRAQRRLVRMETFLLCPADGVYRFGLDCRDAGFVLIGGELAAAWPDEHGEGQWRFGEGLMLGAGVHRLTVFNACTGEANVRVGWIPPGQSEPEAIPPDLLLAPQGILDPAVEFKHRTLVADFEFEIRGAYGFRGIREVFVPVRLRDRTRNRLEAVHRCRWRLGNREWTGSVVDPVLIGRRVHRAALDVRDDLGFTALREREIDCRPVSPAMYAIAFRSEGFPAVSFGRDAVEVVWRSEGAPPPGAALEFAWQVRRADGSVSNGWKTLKEWPCEKVLAAGRADELLDVEWRVRHEGVVLGQESIRFQHAPFERLPVRARGEGLYAADGTRLVLVAGEHDGRYAQPAISEEQAFGHIVCVDDVLASAGLAPDRIGEGYDRELARIVDGPDRPVVEYRLLSGWDTVEHAFWPYAQLVEAVASVTGACDVAVLSLGLEHMAGNGDVGQFERHAAAITEVVTRVLGKAVVWVTPPPFPDQAERIRPYAAAIRRVADARHIPVADLYSAFRGAGPDARLFLAGRERALSREGHVFSAQVIARALLGL